MIFIDFYSISLIFIRFYLALYLLYLLYFLFSFFFLFWFEIKVSERLASKYN